MNTSSYAVKVLGTSFNVYAYDESDKFETTLLKGSVTLGKSKLVNELHMKPGQKIIYDKKSETIFTLDNVSIIQKLM